MDEGQCAMVSEWMTNGNINEFVKKRWEVNRFGLVRLRPCGVLQLSLTTPDSLGMLQKG